MRSNFNITILNKISFKVKVVLKLKFLEIDVNDVLEIIFIF